MSEQAGVLIEKILSSNAAFVASIDSQVEKLPQDVHSILRPFDSVTRSSWITIDFVVVASLETLVPEEMDSLVVDARQAL